MSELAYMERDPSALSDPTNAILVVGAICGLVAASFWMKVYRGIAAPGSEVVGSVKADLGAAACWTSLAFGLICLGFLFGFFTGHF